MTVTYEVYDFTPVQKASIKHARYNMSSATPYFQTERQQVDDNELRTFDYQLIRNDMTIDMVLGYNQDKIVALPIPMEEILISNTGSLQGLTVLNISNDISDFFELKLCNYVLLNDDTNIEGVEISSIDYTTNTLTLVTGIVNNFAAVDVRIYPAALCWLTNYSANHVGYNKNSYSLTFREAVNG